MALPWPAARGSLAHCTGYHCLCDQMILGSSQSIPVGGAAFGHLQGTEKQGWGQRSGSEEEKRVEKEEKKKGWMGRRSGGGDET